MSDPIGLRPATPAEIARVTQAALELGEVIETTLLEGPREKSTAFAIAFSCSMPEQEIEEALAVFVAQVRLMATGGEGASGG